jgi:hypothetical protein
MEPEGSLSSSEESVTDPYPEPDNFSPPRYSLIFNIHFNIILQFTPF